MRTLIRPALMATLVLSFLTGLIYPALVTGLSNLLFRRQASGSLLFQGDSAIGSSLIGQPFTSPRYFWPRPSATALSPYNAAASSGSNLAASNPATLNAIRGRIAALRAADPGNTRPVPVDLVTASGSGLDPHISPAAAEYQVSRVARSRGITEDSVRGLVQRFTEGRQFGILGEARVSVLPLNLALDGPRGSP